MESDSIVQAVQFWIIVKGLMQKLEDARQTAIAGFIDVAVSDPNTAKGDAALGAGWKTKLDSAEKLLNDQLAPLASVLGETESHIRYLFSKNEAEVEAAFDHLKLSVRAEELGRIKDIEKLLTELKAEAKRATAKA